MSDEPRQHQTKIERPGEPAAPAAPEPAPEAAATAVTAPSSAGVPRESQVKAVTPTMGSGVLAAPAPVAAPVPVAAQAAEDDLDDEEEDDEPALTIGQRLRRLSPALVVMSVGSIASLIFLTYAMTSHTTPVPVLLSSAVVTGLIFAADAAVASYMTYQAGVDDRMGRAVLLALIGGIAAVVAAGAFGGTAILLFLLNG